MLHLHDHHRLEQRGSDQCVFNTHLNRASGANKGVLRVVETHSCSVVQCGAVWCSVVQCGAVWCSVVQCGAVWCSVVQCGEKVGQLVVQIGIT